VTDQFNDVADDVRAWFSQLNDTFAAVASGRSTMDALVANYEQPVVMTSDTEHAVLADQEAIAAYMGSVISSLRNDGYMTTEMHREQISVINERAAIIDVDVVRMRDDRSLVARLSAVEIAVRSDDRWRISAVMVRPTLPTA
jgi:hypothetical protein